VIQGKLMGQHSEQGQKERMRRLFFTGFIFRWIELAVDFQSRFYHPNPKK